MSRAEHGFTLIELLICIFIMSIMGVSIALSINQVIRSSEVSGQRLQESRDDQQLVRVLDMDFGNITERFSSVNGQRIMLLANKGLFHSESFGAVFVRSGYLNPGGELARSDLQKVAWRLRGGKLERHTYLLTESTGSDASDPKFSPVAEDVKDFRLRFFSSSGWQESWTQYSVLPPGIEVSIEFKSGEILRRVYVIRKRGV